MTNTKSLLRSIAAATVIGTLAPSCNSVKTLSHPGSIEDSKTLKSHADGIVYALPKRRIEFVVKRTLTKAKDVAKKLVGAKAALDTASKAELQAKGLESEAKAVFENAAQSVKEEAERKYRLAQAATAAATKAKTAASALVAAAEAEVAAAELGPACVVPTYSYSLKLLPAEPDSRYVFRAQHIHRPWRDDEANITTTPEGLLSSAKVTTTDRTGDILVQIAKAVSFFLSPSSTLQADDGKPVAPDCPNRLTHPSFSIQTVFDPSTFAEEGKSKGRGSADSLADKFDAAFTDQLGADINTQLDGLNAPFRLFVEGGDDKRPLGQVLRTEFGEEEAIAESERAKPKSIGGLLYRRVLPYKVSLYQAFDVNDSIKTAPVHTGIVFVPNEGPVGVLPYKAGAFVKTVYDVKFENGMLTSWDADRPSELFAVWRLPLEIVDGVFEGISKIMPFRIEQTQNENKLLELQAANIELGEKLKALQDSLAIEDPSE